MQFTHEHQEIQKTLKRFIDEQINPHVDEWEAAEIFPAHEVFKGLGKLLKKTSNDDLKAYLRVIFNSETYQRMPSQKDGTARPAMVIIRTR